MCDEIRTQVDRLHWVADSESDQALQQGQRLLGKCKSRELGGPAPPEAPPVVSSRKPAAAEARDPKPDRPPRKRKPKLDGELKGFPDAKKPAGEKSGSDSKSEDKPDATPRGLRNPFGP